MLEMTTPADGPDAAEERPSPWDRYVAQLSELLRHMAVTDATGQHLLPSAGIQTFCDLTLDTGRRRGCVFFVGNGASASMASHFSCDLGKSLRVDTCVFTDAAVMTALANDLCFEEVFAEPLRWKMRPGDLLVAISSSGRSPNILRAAEAAASLGGHVVTLSAMDRDNPLRGLGRLNFHVAATTYGQAESAHATILHHWLDMVSGCPWETA